MLMLKFIKKISTQIAIAKFEKYLKVPQQFD